MTLPPVHRSAGLFLFWIGGLCGTVVFLLGNVLPYPLPFATPAAFFLSLVEVEIFFALLIWPLYVPSLQKDGIRGLALLASMAILLLFALPLLLMGANVSGVGAAGLLRSQALVGGLGALGAAIASRLRSALPWYLLAVFVLSTLPPLSHFLEHQMQAKAPLSTAYLSPFWGVASGGAAAWVQSAVAGIAGLVLLFRHEPPR
ncbi:MAG TPA: hypothetical protein VMU54_01120 [Planctomycetota bacterium]|nr:hypothetical protein [Planctomycetota bacterium]